MTDNSPDMEEISLLDILVILAESWVMILLGAIAAAALAFVLASNQPRTYESKMLLSLPLAEVEAALDADPALAAIRSGFELEDASAGGTAGTTPADERTLVTFHGASAEATEAAMTEFMNRLLEPRMERARLPVEAELVAIGRRIDDLDAAAATAAGALDETRSQPEADFSAAAILLSLQQALASDRFERERETMALKTAIDGLAHAMVLAEPSPARQAGGRSPALVAGLAGLGAGFALVLVAFLRHGLRNAARDSQAQEKLRRIRNAFLFRRSAAN